MYKQELQKKKERLQALKLNRMQQRNNVPENDAVGDKDRRKPSDKFDKWLNDVMNPFVTEGKTSTPLQESCSQSKEDEKRSSPQLSRCGFNFVSVTPKERILYGKETQTMERQFDLYQEVEEDTEGADGEVVMASASAAATSPVETAVRDLSEQEKAMIVQSEGFIRSFKRVARITERLLSETSPPENSCCRPCHEEQSNQMVSLNRTFFDERKCRRRAVTALDWSPNFPELFAASYSAKTAKRREDDGLCLLWNLKYRKTSPEMTFVCSSQVMSVSFVEHCPHLVVGGTYCGQVVLWDARSPKRTPALRSSLSSTAHTSPVFCARAIGSRGAEQVITISSDGAVCWWSLEQFTQPLHSFRLQKKSVEYMTATCFDFLSRDVSNFVYGSEEGSVFLARAQQPWHGVKDNFLGHFAPVTGLSAHCGEGPISFYHLFLSSSMDWSINLWSTRDRRPLHTFRDPLGYVYDIGWSPQHPAMFAAANDSGHLDVWNLNEDQEVAVGRLSVCGEETTALNKLCWHSSGTQIVTGDAHGRAHICSLEPNSALPNGDAWSNFEATVKSLQATAVHGYLDESSLFREAEVVRERGSPSLTRKSPRPGIRSLFSSEI